MGLRSPDAVTAPDVYVDVMVELANDMVTACPGTSCRELCELQIKYYIINEVFQFYLFAGCLYLYRYR